MLKILKGLFYINKSDLIENIFTSILIIWNILLIVPLTNTLLPFHIVNLESKNLSILLLTLIIVICIRLLINIFLYSAPFLRKRANKVLFILVSFIIITDFVSVVLFVKDIFTPILHDPYAHSFWAKSILINDSINFFYSPLLHSSSAVLSFGDVFNIPRLIVLITQLSSFIIPLLITLLFHSITRDKRLSVITFLIISCFHFPSNLYYLSGKNSFVLALSLIPIFAYFLLILLKTDRTKYLILLCVTILLIFFAHYPTFGITLFLAIPIITNSIIKYIRTRNWRNLLLFILPFLISTVLASLWFLKMYYLQSSNLSESIISSTPKQNNPVSLIIKDQINSFLTLYFVPLHMLIIIPLLSDKIKLYIKAQIIWAYLLILILPIILLTINRPSIVSIIIETTQLLYPYLLNLLFVFVLIISFKLITIKATYAWILIVFLVLLGLGSNHVLQDNINVNNERLTLISQDDIQAFNFINEQKISDEEFINSGQSGQIPGMIFPVDGAMWLPVFTDNEILIDFMRFTSKDTNASYIQLQKVRESNDDKSIFQEFKNNGFNYIYIDKGVFGEGIRIDQIDNVDFDIIYESGDVKILQLN